jgi:hypothetical protein
MNIGSGRYQAVTEDGLQRSAYPFLWEYYRAASGAPATAALVATSKIKLACLSYSNDPAYGAGDSAMTFAGLGSDRTPSTRSSRAVIIAGHHLISLGDVDAAGHAIWEEYTRTIHVADSLVYYLWTRVQLLPAYRDRTAFIITSDHGRHADAWGCWCSHADGCPGCRRISFVCVGPDFHAGMTSWTPCQQIDVCATIGSLLGFPTPTAGGRILTELIVNPASAVNVPRTNGPVVVMRNGVVEMTNTGGMPGISKLGVRAAAVQSELGRSPAPMDPARQNDVRFAAGDDRDGKTVSVR